MASALSENPASVIHSLNLAHNTLDNQGNDLQSVSVFFLPQDARDCCVLLSPANSKSISAHTEPLVMASLCSSLSCSSIFHAIGLWWSVSPQICFHCSASPTTHCKNAHILVSLYTYPQRETQTLIVFLSHRCDIPAWICTQLCWNKSAGKCRNVVWDCDSVECFVMQPSLVCDIWVSVQWVCGRKWDFEECWWCSILVALYVLEGVCWKRLHF